MLFVAGEQRQQSPQLRRHFTVGAHRGIGSLDSELDPRHPEIVTCPSARDDITGVITLRPQPT
jgi:hypothetical protein